MDASDYERLGVLYLGRLFDPATGKAGDAPYLYDSKDLTTHGVIVGMTGSGKTGLAISLIEEAILDGIPVIAIDPKGDLGNLLLTFPRLEAGDFRPWIDPGTAARAGHGPDEEAALAAARWREGLASSGQAPERIARFAAAAERRIYTPGSRAGRTLSLVAAFGAPPAGLLQDDEALRERVQGSVSGLLALLGIDADPIQSREHILLSTLVLEAFRQGRSADLASLIREIQKPPIERVGVMDLESFFPAKERAGLAMAINNLLASPGFAAWLEGDPLEAGTLLFAADGRPRLSIVSIAHLPDPERMFAVTLILEQLIAWMRSQPGTGSLRALLYMDEIAGYFPPTANPPSKPPLLTLMKQARAFGLGVVLATQNPVDLDYKGLSNAGTWFLGRLQTERDQQRVLDGLAGASAAASGGFDRAAMEQTLAGLRSRVFVCHNVHEDAPVLFQSRQTLSFLAGPLTREQIRTLCSPTTGAVGAPGPGPAPSAPAPALAPPAGAAERPALPASLHECFAGVTRSAGPDQELWYRPALLATAQLHHVDSRAGVDAWRRVQLLASVGDDPEDPWDGARPLASAPRLEAGPETGARFAPLPARLASEKTHDVLRRQLASHLYRACALALLRCAEPRAVSQPGESEAAFRGRLQALLRESRDAAIEKLRQRYAPKLAALRDRRERALEKKTREQDQARGQQLEAAVSIGTTLVGALFGRKLGSAANVNRASRAVRGVGRAAREQGDVSRAEERVEDVEQQLVALEAELRAEIADLERAGAELPLEELEIAPRKGDIQLEDYALVWVPWRVGAGGSAEPACEL